MMMDMIKDETIERAFKGYFDGLPAPQVDLTAAKAELRACEQRRAKIRRGLRWQVPSAVACLLILIVLAFNLLPSLFVTRYSIAQAQAETASYTELTQTYGSRMRMFSKFFLSDNSSADYTLYSVKGETVLLGVEISYIYEFVKIDANVYIDLSGGKYKAKELGVYEGLKANGGSYRYEGEYLNGEYVYRAFYETEDWNYYIDTTSPNSNGFNYFMEKFLG